MSNSQDALLDKIRKLNAKANDPSVTEAEALLYAAKVSELLSAHNLSMASIEMPEEEQSPIGEESYHNIHTANPSAQQLAYAVSLLYFCSIFITTDIRGRKSVVFVGRKHNIEIAKSMTDYLLKTIFRLANAYAKTPAAMEDWDYTFTKARNGFFRGAHHRMTQRITAMRHEQNASAPVRSANGNPSNLPALYEDEKKKLDTFLEAKKLRKGSSRGYDAGGNHAGAGRNAANGISLNAQVGGGRSSTLLR
jgi:hypothetical protein